MGTLPRAKSLAVGLSTHENDLEVNYRIVDEELQGMISFQFPFHLDVDKATKSIIGLWESIFLGQLCLAEEIELQFPIIEGMIEDIGPVISGLYDVRCYRDKIPFVDPPSFKAETVSFTPRSFGFHGTKRACILWSGGTDSTLSLILLANNNYDRIPVHYSVNVDVVELERIAVDVLADHMGMPVLHVRVDFPDFISIGSKYSNYIARPPLENSIPHGRELWLLAPTLIIAKHLGATYICPAHENEVWTARVTHKNKSIWRWDTQSEALTIVLDKFISKYLEFPIRIFSPIATFSDFRKFAVLITEYPELLENMSICYWEHWCGECTKCVRYYLYQRSLGKSLIHFKHDPVKENNPYLESYVYSWQNRELTYWADVQYAVCKIVENERGGLEPLLMYYKEKVYPVISKEIFAIQEKVFGIYPAKLLPDGWDPVLTTPHP